MEPFEDFVDFIEFPTSNDRQAQSDFLIKMLKRITKGKSEGVVVLMLTLANIAVRYKKEDITYEELKTQSVKTLLTIYDCVIDRHKEEQRLEEEKELQALRVAHEAILKELENPNLTSVQRTGLQMSMDLFSFFILHPELKNITIPNPYKTTAETNK